MKRIASATPAGERNCSRQSGRGDAGRAVGYEGRTAASTANARVRPASREIGDAARSRLAVGLALRGRAREARPKGGAASVGERRGEGGVWAASLPSPRSCGLPALRKTDGRETLRRASVSYGVSREVGEVCLGGGCMSRPGCLACDERSTLLVRTGREIQKNLEKTEKRAHARRPGPWRPWLAGGWRERSGLAAGAGGLAWLPRLRLSLAVNPLFFFLRARIESSAESSPRSQS